MSEDDDAYGSDIIVYDDLFCIPEYYNRRIVIKSLVNEDNEEVEHLGEARKIFEFLMRWISCNTYNAVYCMMKDYDDRSPDGIVCNNVSAMDMHDSYNGGDGDISCFERTIYVLGIVKKLLDEGECLDVPDSLIELVNSEISLLREKVDIIAECVGDDIEGDLC